MNKHFFRKFLILSIISLLLFSIISSQIHKEKNTKNNALKLEKKYNNYANFNPEQNGIMILCYHRITPSNQLTTYAQKKSVNSQLHSFDVNEADFKQQMQFLKQHHIEVISVEKMLKLLNTQKPLNKKYVVITFDDIDHTIINNAIPTLEKYQFPYTLFIITGKTNQYLDGSYTASWNAINKVAQSNLCTIGLHTNNSHYQVQNLPRLETMSLAEFKKDYYESVKALKTHLNKPINNLYFAAPYGAITSKELNWLDQRNHFQAAFSLQNDLVTEKLNNKNYPRIIVTTNNFKNIAYWLTGK